MEPQGLHIGLTGAMGSGKGEVIRILRSRSFAPISLSDIVRRAAARAGGAADRRLLQDIGNRLREKEGAGVLGRRVRETILARPPGRWVIDGIRNPAEVAELRKLPRFFLVGVAASRPVLLERILRRRRDTDRTDRTRIEERLNREWGQGEPPGGQQVGRCMEMADFTLVNDGSLPELQEKVGDILQSILEKAP